MLLSLQKTCLQFFVFPKKRYPCLLKQLLQFKIPVVARSRCDFVLVLTFRGYCSLSQGFSLVTRMGLKFAHERAGSMCRSRSMSSNVEKLLLGNGELAGLCPGRSVHETG